MRKLTLAAIVAVSVVVAEGASVASAHASLTTCSIKNNQVFTLKNTPRVVTASFAEPIDPGKSWINVFEGQADHGLINEKSSFTVVGPNKLSLKLPKLEKEKYYLIWYTHSAKDGHYAAGIVNFRVK